MPEEVERYRPWVQLAAFCQTAIQENNGTLSIIRMLDRITVPAQLASAQAVTIPITMVVIFKSGFMRGSAKIGWAFGVSFHDRTSLAEVGTCGNKTDWLFELVISLPR